MDSTATISCPCGCLFHARFQNSSLEVPPHCPQCGAIMDKKSWTSLRETMAQVVDFNYHILKWNSEYQEPRMLVPCITTSTFTD